MHAADELRRRGRRSSEGYFAARIGATLWTSGESLRPEAAFQAPFELELRQSPGCARAGALSPEVDNPQDRDAIFSRGAGTLDRESSLTSHVPGPHSPNVARWLA
jgi:hypothetical protein